MEFPNPAERRYVTQISAFPHLISLSLKHIFPVFFLSLGFQITILNSPAQFLSHTFFSSCDLSLGCLVCVCVYRCLAGGLGIAILVGMWPCMYVDVNECNVCSVCMFLIWGFGFIVSYCGCICSEPLWF